MPALHAALAGPIHLSMRIWKGHCTLITKPTLRLWASHAVRHGLWMHKMPPKHSQRHYPHPHTTHIHPMHTLPRRPHLHPKCLRPMPSWPVPHPINVPSMPERTLRPIPILFRLPSMPKVLWSPQSHTLPNRPQSLHLLPMPPTTPKLHPKRPQQLCHILRPLLLRARQRQRPMHSLHCTNMPGWLHPPPMYPLRRCCLCALYQLYYALTKLSMVLHPSHPRRPQLRLHLAVHRRLHPHAPPHPIPHIPMPIHYYLKKATSLLAATTTPALQMNLAHPRWTWVFILVLPEQTSTDGALSLPLVVKIAQ